jgi:transposase
MGQRYGGEFKRVAVRLALTSGLPRKQISTDLGVGFSTLNKWMQQSRDKDLLKGPQVDQEKELSRLRKENRILREQREILKKRRSSSRAKNETICIHIRLEEDLCHMSNVQGFGGERAWLSRLTQSAHEPTSAG